MYSNQMVMSIRHYYNVIRAFDIHNTNKYLIFLKLIIYYLIQTVISIGIHHHSTSSEIAEKKKIEILIH